MADERDEGGLEGSLEIRARCADAQGRPFEARAFREAADALSECRRALRAVEEWWLREGMHKDYGAPAGIFMLREALARLERNGS